jgi:hypothetical protein
VVGMPVVPVVVPVPPPPPVIVELIPWAQLRGVIQSPNPSAQVRDRANDLPVL